MSGIGIGKSGFLKSLLRALAIATAVSLWPGTVAAAPACEAARIAPDPDRPANHKPVSGPAELDRALSSASGGKVLLLAPGDYGVLNLSSKFRATVTLRSADPGRPACFTGMTLRNAARINFEGILFTYRFGGEPVRHRLNFIVGSREIGFSGCRFVGALAEGMSPSANGYGSGKGLSIRDSDAISIVNSTFTRWWKALLVTNSRDVAVLGNEFHSIRSDGMNFVDVQSVVIENNYLHDFKRSLNSRDHGDMIQFWKTTKRPSSSDVVIRGNTIDVGDGDYIQNIFMGNGKDRTQDPRWHYRNILIENNSIIGNHTHGITVNAANGLTIRNNVLAYKFAGNKGKVGMPRIRVIPSSRNVTITDNIALGYVGYEGQSDWHVSNNRTR
ncbi:hypothetical protein DDZ14_07830 [Maritimibacter sp. 55A14]|uniref:right-handed parallel beta-helix repeat-containing protein n=1 Tax=Maritimibacter sp. 55A14 TaxID=2174844 RepID=UPI000D60DC4E|nr:right-handed parallel beta-helix repeat-containing protein [Maritimibacter sp. 55A14]PWE32989.1 hypothetical protein DDZ14_07830 [Maritimibacter sp. 55A14]